MIIMKNKFKFQVQSFLALNKKYIQNTFNIYHHVAHCNTNRTLIYMHYDISYALGYILGYFEQFITICTKI